MNSTFEREIRTEVTWQVPSGPGKADTEEECAFVLEETIPPGMYADMDQLRSLHQRGRPLVLSDQAINIEAPAHLSPSHTLHIFLPTLRRPASKSSASMAVTVPLHLRYHLPSTDDEVTHVVVSLPYPSLYTNCSVAGSFPKKLPCGKEPGMCTWWKVSFLGDVQPLEFEVPVGNVKHYTLVLVVTLVVVMLGCLAVGFATPGKNTRPDTSHKTR